MNNELLQTKAEYTDIGFKNLASLCDFLPEEERENAVIGLLNTIGWF